MRRLSTRPHLPQLNHNFYRRRERKEAGSGPCLQCHNLRTFLFFARAKSLNGTSLLCFSAALGLSGQCVFSSEELLRQKAENQRSDALKSAFSGFRSFTNCIIRVLNHHRLTILPSLRMVLNSSCKSFSKKGKKGWRPRPLDLLRSF